MFPNRSTAGIAINCFEWKGRMFVEKNKHIILGAILNFKQNMFTNQTTTQ